MESKYLIFSNKGELEESGLRLMGASSKRNATNQIGFFGTGFKYALAFFLRDGAQIEIYSGTKRIPVSTRIQTLRGETHHEITINNEGIGATLGLGPKWVTWMAVREMYCNALDEGDSKVEVGVPAPVEGRTLVCVSYANVRQVWEDRQLFFRLSDEGETLFNHDKTKRGRVLPKADHKTRIYRKGILVKEIPGNSAFDYEMDDLNLNEDRTCTDYDINERVWRLLQDASLEVKKAVLNQVEKDEELFESRLPSSYMMLGDWKPVVGNRVVMTRDEFRQSASNLEGERILVLPTRWVEILKKDTKIRVVDLVFNRKAVARNTKAVIRGSTIDRAIEIVNEFGFSLNPSTVLVVDSFEDDAMGSFEDGVISVLDGMNLRQTVGVLCHEIAHRDSGASDCTRQFERQLEMMMLIVMSKSKRELR